MSNQLSKIKTTLTSEKMREQFAAALPKHLTEERFVRIAITALNKTPKLQECTQESLMKCLLDLSAMGIEPDGRRAHLIPFGKECTLVLDFKGLVELMRRSGDVESIQAEIVCENDVFVHNIGEIETHTFDLRKPRGEMYAVYAQATLKGGAKQTAIMSKEEVDAIRGRSRSGKSGPWVTDYKEMAKKTAVRRLSKMITLSPDIMDAVERADSREFELRNVSAPRRTTVVNPFQFPAIETPSEVIEKQAEEMAAAEEGGAQ